MRVGCLLQEKGQRHLVAKLPKNLGWSVGTEMRESLYQITAKNTATVKPNMLFNVSIGALHRKGLCMRKDRAVDAHLGQQEVLRLQIGVVVGLI